MTKTLFPTLFLFLILAACAQPAPAAPPTLTPPSPTAIAQAAVTDTPAPTETPTPGVGPIPTPKLPTKTDENGSETILISDRNGNLLPEQEMLALQDIVRAQMKRYGTAVQDGEQGIVDGEQAGFFLAESVQPIAVKDVIYYKVGENDPNYEAGTLMTVVDNEVRFYSKSGASYDLSVSLGVEDSQSVAVNQVMVDKLVPDESENLPWVRAYQNGQLVGDGKEQWQRNAEIQITIDTKSGEVWLWNSQQRAMEFVGTLGSQASDLVVNQGWILTHTSTGWFAVDANNPENKIELQISGEEIEVVQKEIIIPDGINAIFPDGPISNDVLLQQLTVVAEGQVSITEQEIFGGKIEIIEVISGEFQLPFSIYKDTIKPGDWIVFHPRKTIEGSIIVASRQKLIDLVGERFGNHPNLRFIVNYALFSVWAVDEPVAYISTDAKNSAWRAHVPTVTPEPTPTKKPAPTATPRPTETLSIPPLTDDMRFWEGMANRVGPVDLVERSGNRSAIWYLATVDTGVTKSFDGEKREVAFGDSYPVGYVTAVEQVDATHFNVQLNMQTGEQKVITVSIYDHVVLLTPVTVGETSGAMTVLFTGKTFRPEFLQINDLFAVGNKSKTILLRN